MNSTNGEGMGKKEVVKNIVEVAAKTALSAIPIGGTLASSTWDALKEHALNKRLDDWQDKIESRLSNIEATLEEIGSNELFATTMIQATEQAIKVSSEKKRDYLANAVLNSISINVEESIILIYMDMLSRYSELHIKILKYFNNPRAYSIEENNYYMGSAKDPLFDVFPELRDREALVDRVVKDLFNDGVMNSDNLNVMMTSQGMFASRTTRLGREFLMFISNTNTK